MGPKNDDDAMVARPAVATPARSDAPGDPGAAGEGGHAGENVEGVEEGPGMPGMEEAGYGHGV